MIGAQFINWHEVPNPDGGKPIKMPCNRVGDAINAHDPAQWMTEDVARNITTSRRTGLSLGVAYVLTAADPYVCIDLDACREGDGWSAFAMGIVARFPGAMVEVSHSGTGLHIWCRASAPEGHRTRSAAVPGLEVYSQRRFIALGTGATCDAETDHTAALCAMLDELLPGVTVTPAEWSDGPCAEWSGPDDDADLINRMTSAQGIAAMTGRATLVELWDADAVALARTYPSVTGAGWDNSAADAALAAHLAWWTGSDGARMDRLMKQSGLNRTKFERVDYMQRTITGGMAVNTGCYNDGKRGPVIEPVDVMPGYEIEVRTGSSVQDADDQTNTFTGCMYVRDQNRVMVPDGALLNQQQFNAEYGGSEFILDFVSSKMAKGPWDVFTESRMLKFPRVMSTCFRPSLTPGAVVTEEGETRVNIYRPLDVPSMAGDASPFLGLVEKLFPDDGDRAIIMAYAAACVQYPGVKFQWCPLVQGVEGNGKTFIATCISHAVGLRYSHTPNAQDISNKFNAWVLGKLFAVVEEVHTRDRRECTEALKPLITNTRLEIQGKGSDQVTADNFVNFWLTSNWRDAIAKSRGDRRYAVFYTPQQEPEDLKRDGMSGSYFPELWGWLRGDGAAIVTHFLQTYDIPDELNPATLLHRAPLTTSTQAAVRESLGTVEQEIMEAVAAGRAGFCGGYVSSQALTALLDETRHKIAPKRRRLIIESLGYVAHPGLIDGRTSQPVGLEDGGARITLYITLDTPSAMLMDEAQIVRDYRAAQGYLAPPEAVSPGRH